jgi:putative ABC transport system permease protein
MSQRLPLSWLQLKHEKMKLVAAVAGVTVSVVLMWMQLGLMKALFASAVVFHGSLDGELVVIHSQYEHLMHSKRFSSRLLYRLRGSAAVEDVAAIYLAPSEWKNPWSGEMRSIQCYGIETDRATLNIPGLAEHVFDLRRTDVFLFDRMGRPRFGDVLSRVARKETIELEINRRRMTLAGIVDLGASFGVDGTLLVSHANFLRLFPEREPGEIDVGVVKLKAGVRPEQLQAAFQEQLGPQVRVLTRPEFAEVELLYWRTATPIGIVFTSGTIVGFFIGFIVVYQILFTDVTNHLPHFATMKAMGFSDGYLRRLVLNQALQLAVLGYVPGSLLAAGLYKALKNVTLLPMEVTPARTVGLLLATVAMCMFSGLLAVRKLTRADPADVF